jgi:putative membrane protein
MPMMYYDGNGWTWGGALVMALSMLFWVGLLALILWAIVRAFQGRGPINQHQVPSAIDTLQQRYARGEIDAKTYDEMLSRLTSGSRMPPAPTA